MLALTVVSSILLGLIWGKDIPSHGCDHTPGNPGGTNCTSSLQLPVHCSDYMILDEEDRSTDNFNIVCADICYCDIESKATKSPAWQGDGFYRFLEPAGSMLPEYAPGVGHCGTYLAGIMHFLSESFQRVFASNQKPNSDMLVS